MSNELAVTITFLNRYLKRKELERQEKSYEKLAETSDKLKAIVQKKNKGMH